jgi:hypothetical protein
VAYSGVLEPWVMDDGFAGYPVADPTAQPPAVFRIYDRRDPREIIRVADTRAGSTWQVMRATEGSAGVAHAAGFEVAPFLTKAGMDGRAAGTPSRTGVVWRAARTASQTFTGSADHAVASLSVPGDGLVNEANPRSVYEVMAWGYFTTGARSIPIPPENVQESHFQCGLYWGAIAAGTINFPLYGATVGEAGVRWRVHATFNLWAGSGSSSISLWVGSVNAASAPIRPALFGPTSPPGYNQSGTVNFRLQVSTGTVGGGDPGPSSVTVQGSRIGRAA